MRLSTAALAALAPTIARPRYDRGAVRPGIVHLGTGAFHRAHQAVYIDDCLARGESNWGILGASLRAADTRDALAPQDGLYTAIQRDGSGAQARIIGCVQRVLVAREAPPAVVAAMFIDGELSSSR